MTEKSRRSSTKRLGTVAYALRIILVVAAVLGMHAAASRRAAIARLRPQAALPLSSVQRLLPAAVNLEPFLLGASKGYKVLGPAEEELAFALSTSPEADNIIGYAGPNEVLLLVDHRQRVTQASLLRSGDTAEHASQVEESGRFWRQFEGWSLGKPNSTKIDGVSGATLTSLAIAEAIQLRIGGQHQSLRFPDPIRLQEAQTLLPEVDRLGVPSRGGLIPLFSATDESLGWIARTGPLVDSEEGYQGPTELLLLIGQDQVLKNVKIRRSYDNEPYVGYVKQEYSFWSRFKGRSLADLADLDLEREGIEGVSGATMTSLAVARTVATSLQRLQSQAEQQSVGRRWNWSLTEIMTAALALAGILWSRSPWRGRLWPRRVWQLVCFVLLGLLAGNLLSLALLAGWTRGGVPFQLAPGLSLLLTVAVIWPILTKENVYCDHLCPHGALQQWLIRCRSRNATTSPNAANQRWGISVINRLLTITPYVAIAAALAWLLFDWPIPLAWLEPFDAYSWRVGLTVSSLVWLVGMSLSYWRPMSYCRLLCPTGKVLDFIRRKGSRRGHSPSSWLGDAVLILILVTAWWQSR